MTVHRPLNRVKWYRTPVPAADLARLNQRSDWLGLRQSVGFLLVLAALGGLAWQAANRGELVLAAALTIVYAGVHKFTVNGFHELCHKTVFKTKALNTIFLHIYSFIGWHSHISFWASHQAHHRYTLHPPDDLEVVLPVKLTLRSYLAFAFINFRGFWLRLKHDLLLSFGHIEEEWEAMLFPPENVEGRRKLFGWARTLLIGHGLIAAAAIWQGWWMLIPLVTLAPFYAGGFQYLINVSQHIGLCDEVDDYRLNTRTIMLNPVLAFLYWQMNYHIEHHMYAAVPFYHLPELHRLVKHDMPKAPNGVMGTWRQVIPILLRQKREPGYQFVPETPARSSVH